MELDGRPRGRGCISPKGAGKTWPPRHGCRTQVAHSTESTHSLYLLKCGWLVAGAAVLLLIMQFI